MPRRARLRLAGVAWHIIQRGNNRSACFYAEADYRYYLETLGEQAQRWGCAVHAYVLMTNHVHLLVTPTDEHAVGLMMKHLGQRYVQTINRTYRRTGTLWEGRYRSCLTQSGRYVLACHRYIELNPVRAGMVRRPEDYRWSSYHDNGLGLADPVLSPHAEYLALGRDAASRRQAYRDLFRSAAEEDSENEIRAATNGNYVCGEPRFQAEISLMLNRRVSRKPAGRPKRATEDRDAV